MLRMVTIYEGARDFPQSRFVARLWHVSKGGSTAGEVIAHGGDLEDCRRAALARGCDAQFPRDPMDDPMILETWI